MGFLQPPPQHKHTRWAPTTLPPAASPSLSMETSAMDPNRFAAAPYEPTSAAQQGRQRRRDDKCKTGGGATMTKTAAAQQGWQRRHDDEGRTSGATTKAAAVRQGRQQRRNDIWGSCGATTNAELAAAPQWHKQQQRDKEGSGGDRFGAIEVGGGQKIE